MTGRTNLASGAGQASVELVAILPLVLAAALAAAALLAGHAATEHAGQAAQGNTQLFGIGQVRGGIGGR